MVICKAHETCPREGGGPESTVCVSAATETLGDCHASLVTCAADGRLSTAS